MSMILSVERNVSPDEAKAVWERMLLTDVRPTPYKVSAALTKAGRAVSPDTVRGWKEADWRPGGETTAQGVTRILLRDGTPILSGAVLSRLTEVSADLSPDAAHPAVLLTNQQLLTRTGRAIEEMLFEIATEVKKKTAEMLRDNPDALAKVAVAVAAARQSSLATFREALSLAERTDKLREASEKTAPGEPPVQEDNPLADAILSMRKARNGH